MTKRQWTVFINLVGFTNGLPVPEVEVADTVERDQLYHLDKNLCVAVMVLVVAVVLILAAVILDILCLSHTYQQEQNELLSRVAHIMDVHYRFQRQSRPTQRIRPVSCLSNDFVGHAGQ